MNPRPALALALAIAAAVSVSALAGAATGPVTAAQTAGALTPLRGAIPKTGLIPIRDIAFDAGGRRLYATGNGRPIHASLARNARSGALGTLRAGTCSVRRGFEGRSCRTPAQVEISADGRYGYIIGDYYGSAAMTTLTRGRDGALSPLREGAVSALGTYVRAFVLSRDGRNAYVAADRSVVKLDRNRASGLLVRGKGYHGCHPERRRCPALRGVFKAGGIAQSADGRSLYVTSERGIAILRRSSTGALRQIAGPAGCIASVAIDGCTVGHDVGGSDSPAYVNSKISARRIVVSRDGTRVYAASNTGIAVFARSAADGSLRQLPGAAGCVASVAASLCAPARELRHVRAIALSADGRTLYATVRAGVAVLRRGPGSSGLIQLAGREGCVNGTGAGGCASVAGLTRPLAIAVTPDDRHVYVGSETGVLTAFSRQR